MNIKEHEDRLVVKANNIIEAKYKLSTREQKVLIFFISMLESYHQPGHIYSTHVNEIMSALNQSGTKWGDAYKTFKEIVSSLKSKPLVIENEKEIIICNWLGAVSLIKRSGEIKFAFEPQMEPFLFEVKKNFTQFPFSSIVNLKSSFSIRMYELLKQYVKIGKRKFDINTLKRQLGIEKELYDRYYDFKKRVILTAQRELNEKTDISFEFVEKKMGRKVVELQFTIIQTNSVKPNKPTSFKSAVKKTVKEEPQKSLFSDKEEEQDGKEARLKLRLSELGLSKIQIQKVMTRVGADPASGIWKLLNEIKMAARDGRIKGSLAGYAVKLIDSKYNLGFYEN